MSCSRCICKRPPAPQEPIFSIRRTWTRSVGRQGRWGAARTLHRSKTSETQVAPFKAPESARGRGKMQPFGQPCDPFFFLGCSLLYYIHRLGRFTWRLGAFPAGWFRRFLCPAPPGAHFAYGKARTGGRIYVMQAASPIWNERRSYRRIDVHHNFIGIQRSVGSTIHSSQPSCVAVQCG